MFRGLKIKDGTTKQHETTRKEKTPTVFVSVLKQKRQTKEISWLKSVRACKRANFELLSVEATIVFSNADDEFGGIRAKIYRKSPSTGIGGLIRMW